MRYAGPPLIRYRSHSHCPASARRDGGVGGNEMKAVYIQEQGDIDKLVYGDLPDPEPGPGEVLVRLHAAALNRLDTYARSGGSPSP